MESGRAVRCRDPSLVFAPATSPGLLVGDPVAAADGTGAVPVTGLSLVGTLEGLAVGKKSIPMPAKSELSRTFSFVGRAVGIDVTTRFPP